MENNEMGTNENSGNVEQNSSVDNVTPQNSVNVVESVPNNTIQNNFTDSSLGQNGSGQNNKSNKGLIILVIILSVLIVGLVGFVVYDKVLNKDKNEDEIVTDDSDYNSKNKKDDDSKNKDDNKKDKDDDKKDDDNKDKDGNKKDNASTYLVCTQSASGVDITFNIGFKNNSIQSMDFSYDMSLEEYTSEQISLIEQQDFCDAVKKSMSEYSGAFSDCQQNIDNKHLVVSSTFDISKLNENILNSMVTIEDAKTELEEEDYICTIK